jgi:hypothetical protein
MVVSPPANLWSGGIVRILPTTDDDWALSDGRRATGAQGSAADGDGFNALSLQRRHCLRTA